MQFASDLGAVIGAAFQVQSSANDAGAVAHDADAHAGHAAGGGGLEADAVVFDGEEHTGVVPGYGGARPRAGVAAGVLDDGLVDVSSRRDCSSTGSDDVQPWEAIGAVPAVTS